MQTPSRQAHQPVGQSRQSRLTTREQVCTRSLALRQRQSCPTLRDCSRASSCARRSPTPSSLASRRACGSHSLRQRLSWRVTHRTRSLGGLVSRLRLLAMVPKVAPSSSTDLAEEEPASYGPRRPVALHGNPFGSRVPLSSLGLLGLCTHHPWASTPSISPHAGFERACSTRHPLRPGKLAGQTASAVP